MITDLRHEKRWTVTVILAAIGVLATALPAMGVVSVHDVFWYVGDGNIPANGKRLSVMFDATVTPADASGLKFSIVETGSQQELVALEAPHLVPVPAVGSPLTITFVFDVRCEADGSLSAIQRSVWVTYCGPILGGGMLDDSELMGEWSSGVGSGPFTLSVVDESGTSGTGPQSTLLCAPTADAEMDPFMAAKQVRQRRFDRVAEDGDSGTIGIYFDQEGTICSGEVLPFVPTTFYVVARPNGVSSCGFAGTEFRFAGVPDSWQVFPVPPDEALVLGNPFTIGVNVAFSTCQTSETRVIYTVLALASEYEPDVMLTIEARNPPTNPRRNCPLMNVCAGEGFPAVCIDGVSCYINPSSPKACAVSTAVAERTWSAVKRLYRESRTIDQF
jgi:hypothetical protein